MEAAEATREPEDRHQSRWLTRIVSVFRRDSDKETDDDASLPEWRPAKPELTIAVDTPISRRFATRGTAEDTVDDGPTSAWSVSPGPPQTLPWLPLQTAGKKPLVPPFPLRPQHKGSVNARHPGDLSPPRPIHSYQASVPASPLSVYPSSVVQAYQGNDGRYPALPTQSSYHNRSSSVPFYMHSNEPMQQTDRCAPPKFEAADPFQTPFDDDVRVPSNTAHPRRSSAQVPRTPLNPFAAVAF